MRKLKSISVNEALQRNKRFLLLDLCRHFDWNNGLLITTTVCKAGDVGLFLFAYYNFKIEMHKTFVFISKFFSVNHPDFLHAYTFDGANSNRNVWRKVIQWNFLLFRKRLFRDNVSSTEQRFAIPPEKPKNVGSFPKM